jgi:hypothetical protein
MFGVVCAFVSGQFRTWGSTPAERRARYRCEHLVPDPDDMRCRAIDVHASASVTFRWVCQVLEAPYSYDWLDNLGRPSPRWLTPGAESPEVGERGRRGMAVFKVASVRPGRELTLLARGPRWLGGAVAVSYVVKPTTGTSSRIVVKMLIRYPSFLARTVARPGLVADLAMFGDFLMMRKQLLNLREHAERDAASWERGSRARRAG